MKPEEWRFGGSPSLSPLARNLDSGTDSEETALGGSANNVNRPNLFASTTTAARSNDSEMDSGEQTVIDSTNNMPARRATTSAVGPLVVSQEMSNLTLPNQSAMSHSSTPSPHVSYLYGTNRPQFRSQLYYIYSMPLYSIPDIVVRRMARKIIKYAARNMSMDEQSLRCLNCYFLPSNPVTGKCGHMRCFKCIQRVRFKKYNLSFRGCPCGEPGFKTPHVNILARNVLDKLLATEKNLRSYMKSCFEAESLKNIPVLRDIDVVPELNEENFDFMNSFEDQSLSSHEHRLAEASSRIPISLQVRFDYAFKLIDSYQYVEAASQLARVAATANADLARKARKILEQILSYVTKRRFCPATEKVICELIMSQSTKSWLRPSDLECVLCFETLSKPVTTPCGHTFCHTCIERSLDYQSTCPLCKRSLGSFAVRKTPKMNIIQTALISIGAVKPERLPDPNVIPIFVCTVAFPGIPCSLFIFNPRYWLMIRRVLKSENRIFGMIPAEMGQTHPSYGTVLEVRDCIQLQDGSYILSTVGVSRFKIIERDVCDGCDVARVEPLVDKSTDNASFRREINYLANRISKKSALWIQNMPNSLLSDILTSYGSIPVVDMNGAWWNSADGPMWLWWIIAILPIRPEVKILILSTNSIHKRLTAVSRTLNAVIYTMINQTETDRHYEEERINSWLERNL
ncbi:uncharacterized protein ACR2FA_000607 [Aphomia sociella]